MVTEILTTILYIVAALIFPLMAWLNIRQFDKERTEWNEQRNRERFEWNAERSKLLDRIQSGGLSEYKAQERADTPIIRREKDPLVAKLESEPWL